MFLLAIILYVLDRFDSPVLAGWISFAAMAPGMAVSPLAGALLDRVGAEKGIAIDMAVSAVLVLALAAAGMMGGASAPLLLALVALYSLTSPLGAAGIRTLLPRLVRADALDAANALDASSYALTDVVGPALAGVLFGLTGAHVTMLLIALLYVAASVSLVPLLRKAAARFGRAGPLWREAVAGLGYLIRNAALRGLALSYALYQMSWGILIVVVPVFVVRELGAGAAAQSAVGAIWAISGVAGGLGALGAGHLQTLDRERRIIALGTFATAFAIYPVSAHLGLLGLTLGLALVGFLAGPIDVCTLGLRQRRTEPAWLGRVLAVSMSLNTSGAPLGAALGGILVTRSMTAALAVAALASILAAIAASLLIPVRAERP
jgi:MFS family permease